MQVIDKLIVEKYGIEVEADILSIGKDWIVAVSGGMTPHIGAVSYGNREEEKNISLGTHKELAVTRKMFARLNVMCAGNLLITGGIHIDHITPEQIDQVMEICDILTEKAAEILNAWYGNI
jgi:hypothetical protein